MPGRTSVCRFPHRHIHLFAGVNRLHKDYFIAAREAHLNACLPEHALLLLASMHRLHKHGITPAKAGAPRHWHFTARPSVIWRVHLITYEVELVSSCQPRQAHLDAGVPQHVLLGSNRDPVRLAQ
jgi:hypothetical protein